MTMIMMPVKEPTVLSFLCMAMEVDGGIYNKCNYCEVTSPRPHIYRNNYLDYIEMKVRPKLF